MEMAYAGNNAAAPWSTPMKACKEQLNKPIGNSKNDWHPTVETA
jgi:hypothetical protein